MRGADLESRARLLRRGPSGGSCVCYWMSRDQRAEDNPALAFAVEMANRLDLPVLTFFALAPGFLGAARRHYAFMFDALEEVEGALTEKGIGFRLLLGEPKETVLDSLGDSSPACMVTDFDPLRAKRTWREGVYKETDLTIYEVDAHNIVPCWLASNKREWSAATLRRKLASMVPSFLTDPTPTKTPDIAWKESPGTDWRRVRASVRADNHGERISWAMSGTKAGHRRLDDFISHGLSTYPDLRNDPNEEGQSGLSPYLHFGQISPQRVAWEASRSRAPEPSKQAFLEELIVRRELSDNFCLHAPDYDSFSGFPEWSKASLDAHRGDAREYLYSAMELEAGNTHDRLWNAAQAQMVRQGKMHGYLRMYWAKKILEWTETPEEAMRIAVLLNDRYELDGRDPNGYAGIAWSIGGVHDRAWPSRKVFGKVRYMSYTGARSKFDVESFISRWA